MEDQNEKVVFIIEELGTDSASKEVFRITEPEVTKNSTSTEVIARKKVNIEDCPPGMSRRKLLSNWCSVKCRCFMCNYCSVEYSNIILHLGSVHGVIATEDICYKCDECENVSQDYASFLNHMSFKHYPELKTCCDICGINFKFFANLSQHREFSHIDTTKRPELVYCILCERAFSTKEELKKHYQNHFYICETCQRKFAEKFEFEKHQISNNCGNICCAICERSFQTSLHLQEHIIQHHLNSGQMKCRLCEKTFQTENPRNHLECEQCCGKMFSSRKTLQGNSIPISKMTLYQCRNCKRAFKQQCDLERHSRIHKQQKDVS